MPGKQAFGHYGDLQAQLPKIIAGGRWSSDIGQRAYRRLRGRKPDFTYAAHISEG